MQALVGLAVLSLAVWPELAAERSTQAGDPIGFTRVSIRPKFGTRFVEYPCQRRPLANA